VLCNLLKIDDQTGALPATNHSFLKIRQIRHCHGCLLIDTPRFNAYYKTKGARGTNSKERFMDGILEAHYPELRRDLPAGL
jgi:hypothetical protein